MARRDPEYKPLLFTTTLRNPERIKDFMRVISSYNAQLLNNDLVMKIVKDLIKQKLYCPMYVKRKQNLKYIYYDEDSQFSNAQIIEIINNSPQNHKEAGFDKGWPSRFDTWYKFLKELGFIYYNMNEPIQVSEAGLNLSVSDEIDKRHLEQQVFLNAFAKYNRINPFRRILNSNKPLILLLEIIKNLRDHYGAEVAGISIKEIPLLIVWKDNNAEELTNKIIEIRDTYGFTPSEEIIYSICKDVLGINQEDEKRFKMSNILKELPDEFVRKMRLTGLISIRGYGRFVDYNNSEINKINYILENYSENVIFNNELEYFNYMRNIDVNLVSLESVYVVDLDQKEVLFNKWVDEIDKEILLQELSIVASRNTTSRHDVFKYIDGPIRLEFLTALSIKKYYPNVNVKPNYNIDDEGLPTSFAQGGEPDIVCEDEYGNVLYEVTLLTGTQQNIREMPAIARHLRVFIKEGSQSYSVMLAPTIHPDTLEYSEFIKIKDDIDVYPVSIPNYIEHLSIGTDFRDVKG
jgi:hypothetical protein